MVFKHAHKGLTLMEILLSLAILSVILIYLVPQQLKSSHEELIDKTTGQMNTLALAARNYYQAHRSRTPDNISAWPQKISDLTSGSTPYLPTSALCSNWTKVPDAQSAANNNGNDCANHQEYALFPANATGVYDTTVPGIAANGNNSGGNFWGLSITLPNSQAAAEIRKRLPFATTCLPTDLRKTNTPCTSTSNTVTIVVPRPAQWPAPNTPRYAKDGLIQTMGTVLLCNNNGQSSNNPPTPTIPCSSNYTATINMPQNCGTDENNIPLTPALFAYPIQFSWLGMESGNTNHFAGIYLHITTNSTATPPSWTITGGSNDNTGYSMGTFGHFAVAYFTVCQPATLQTGSWSLEYNNGST